ncbi:hypothetical protein C8J57DRAFT_1730114 [Mycena rebaudengoi]|nr:hypothetical protein C8J57DRAFT_1730114 [Mycena rebaudengoi]
MVRSALSPLLLRIGVLIQVLSVYLENSIPSDTTHSRLRILPVPPPAFVTHPPTTSTIHGPALHDSTSASACDTSILRSQCRAPSCAALRHTALPPIRIVLVAPRRRNPPPPPDGVFHTSMLQRCSRGFASSTAQNRTRRAMPALRLAPSQPKYATPAPRAMLDTCAKTPLEACATLLRPHGLSAHSCRSARTACVAGRVKSARYRGAHRAAHTLRLAVLFPVPLQDIHIQFFVPGRCGMRPIAVVPPPPPD